jgi:hypothetical protein
MAAVIAGAFWLVKRNHGHPPPRYYAAITSAGLGLGWPDGITRTSFDLSLGVAAPPGRPLTGDGYCLEGGTSVQVSYRGAPLALAVVASWEAVCAGWWTPPGNVVWMRIVALGNNTTMLPVGVVDVLADDARRGAREFDVSIVMADGKTTALCAAQRVGNDDKTASACNLLHYYSP